MTSVALKANGYRPKDLKDIRVVAENFPNLDIQRIQQWVKAFSEALELPDLWDQIKPLLKSQNPSEKQLI